MMAGPLQTAKMKTIPRRILDMFNSSKRRTTRRRSKAIFECSCKTGAMFIARQADFSSPYSFSFWSKYFTKSGAPGQRAAGKQPKCALTSASSWWSQSTSIRGISWMASMASLSILTGASSRSVWLRQKMQAHATVSLPARRIGSGAMLISGSAERGTRASRDTRGGRAIFPANRFAVKLRPCAPCVEKLVDFGRIGVGNEGTQL